MKVYLLWDNSRAEHGEEATLVSVHATKAWANITADELGLDPSESIVDEREVQGADNAHVAD